MLDIIQAIHSILRWVIVLVAVIAAVKFAVGWLDKQTYKPMDRGLMSGYTGLLDLQMLLGIILFIIYWVQSETLAGYRVEHAVTMIVAVAVVHLSRRWREAEDRVKFRNNLLVVAASILLIVAGVFVLPQGWFG